MPLVVLFCLFALCGFSAEPTKPDVVITIGTLHGKLRFDKEFFEVEPGARVQLTLNNTDEMQHNLLILTPGRNMVALIGQKALLLGPAGPEKHFVPDSTNVLFHTKIVDPHKKDTITFTAPTTPGEYPYVCTLPGHFATMRGVMRVGKRSPGLRDLQFAYFEGSWQKLPANFGTPKQVGKAELLDISLAEKDQEFGMEFKADLELITAGDYSFFLRSDDGAQLLINDKLVLDNDGIHGAAAEKSAKLFLPAGKHKFLVRYFEYQGGEELHLVWSGPGFERVKLTPAATKQDLDAHKYHLHVMNEPMVVRAFVENAPARAINVGLPGGMNYCFDPDALGIAFGWTGMFLDIGPDRGKGVDRGGQICKLLGERFSTGHVPFPLRIKSSSEPKTVKFLGYSKKGIPTFYFSIDGTEVEQKITSYNGRGLACEFIIKNPAGTVYYVTDEAEVKLSSSTGKVEHGLAVIPQALASKFTINLEPK